MVAGVTFVSAVAPRVGMQQVVTSFSGNFMFSDEIGASNKSLSGPWIISTRLTTTLFCMKGGAV